ncbi:hypothetical protein, partial [Candidatus Mycoplasma haematohominis]|uniref:hypothetical protein n=1 Tax=Candidatus Mycoplasma haematohominis TaxID=1494318 RepID=UPI001C0A67CE
MASSGALAAAGVLGAGAIGATSVGTYYAINKPGVEAEPTAVIPGGSDQPSNSGGEAQPSTSGQGHEHAEQGTEIQVEPAPST